MTQKPQNYHLTSLRLLPPAFLLQVEQPLIPKKKLKEAFSFISHQQRI